MKRIPVSLVVLLSGLLLAGCLVRSTEPWLGESSKVTSPSLAGSWLDAQQKMTVFFTPEGSNYQVGVVQEGKDASRFTASLHRLDARLVLVVGPGENSEKLDVFVQQPVYMVFGAELKDDTLKLFMLDLEVAPGRIRGSALAPFLSGDKDKGFLLTAPTGALERFLREQVDSPDFFQADPLYTLKRKPAAPVVATPPKAP